MDTVDIESVNEEMVVVPFGEFIDCDTLTLCNMDMSYMHSIITSSYCVPSRVVQIRHVHGDPATLMRTGNKQYVVDGRGGTVVLHIFMHPETELQIMCKNMQGRIIFRNKGEKHSIKGCRGLEIEYCTFREYTVENYAERDCISRRRVD